LDLPSGYADIVRAHHPQTIGYLLATQPECQRIRAEEIRQVKRRLVALDAEDLPRLAPKGSWLLAVLLGRGDDAAAVAAWADRRVAAADLDRVRFYCLPRIDIGAALRAWTDAGLGVPLVAEVRDFASFHKVFGKHLNDRVWSDHR
jgi:hypothetical protein